MNFYGAVLFFCLAFLNIFNSAFANDRHFTFLYESETLGKGFKEIELSTTTRLGRIGYYAGIDQRMEFEVGITNHLQTAFYLNFNSTTQDNGTGINQSSSKFEGISSEWKYRISPNKKGSIGFALYSELGLSTDKIELETKLIFDKKIGNTLFALNLTGDPEWYLSPGKTNTEVEFEGSFGVSHFFSKNFSAGIEIINSANYTKETGIEHVDLFAGPTVAYFQPSWWVALSIMPQITALKGKTEGTSFDLDDHEKLDARLLLSFSL